ncbi:MAG: glutamine synthetase, partial [Methanobacteriaceae archaeon]|nr:glutamine synthetase [Methanobacteriaceae archaeon]
LWEAYHALEIDDVVKSSLGDHVYEKLLSIKHKECDDYRIHVFPYELNKYLSI